jgi:heptosyltransferase-1
MEPRNILIIKLSAIGDVVMATPVIRVLRNAYPGARLTWLVEEASSGLLCTNPLLDEVMVWPKEAWKGLFRARSYMAVLREARLFTGALRSRRFDLVLDLQGFLKSGLIAMLSGAPERVGLASREGSRLLMRKVVPWDRSERRIGAQYHQFVRGLGLDPGDFRMDIALAGKEEAFVRDFREARGLSGPYAALCPFSSKPQKEWPEERWPRLAMLLAERYGMHSLILGGSADREKALRIEEWSRGNAFCVAGEATLKESAALAKHASLLVGGDTALTHMGIAFQVPTVAVFGSTFPYDDTGLAGTAIIYKGFGCSPCKRHPVCAGDFPCLSAIGVEEVLGAASRLLEAA